MNYGGRDENRSTGFSVPHGGSARDGCEEKHYRFIFQKERKEKAVGKCAIFASYNGRGKISEYVVYYLSKLKEEVDYIVFVADNNLKSTDEFSKIEKYVDYALFERHGSYDFGSYKRGIEYLKSQKLLEEIEELYVINDSCYGPVNGFHDVFNEMRAKDCDFWGLVDSNDSTYHISSFFYCFKQPVISDPYFLQFFSRIHAPISWEYAVSNLERKLTVYLLEKYKSACYLPDYCDKNALAVYAGNRNSTLWPMRILRDGFPLVKVKALNGGFGYDLHEEREKVFEYIRGKNPKLYSLIIQDLEERKSLNTPGNEDFFEKISSCKIISFDIFDTLLVRPFSAPVMLFDYVEHKYERKEFCKSRIDAERMARIRSKGKEINIKDIYELMPPKFHDVMELELTEELNLCAPNPKMTFFYEHAVKSGKKLIAVSDMYLSADFLTKLIKKNGFTEIEKVYSSSDYIKTKGSGKLFETVLREENCNACDVFHIGDNYYSDYEMPSKTGMSAFYQEKLFDYFIHLPGNAKYANFYNSLPTIGASSHIMLMARHMFETELKTNSRFYELGYCIGGPFVCGYLDFICKEAVKNNIDKLFFVARDGYILKKAYEKMFYSTYHIDSEYVYLNRAVVLGATGEFSDIDVYLSTLMRLCHAEDHSLKVYENQYDNKKEYKAKISKIKSIVQENNGNLKKHLLEKAGKSQSIAVVDMTTTKMTSLFGAREILGSIVKMGFFSAIFETTDVAFPYEVFSDRRMTANDEKVLQLCEKVVSSPEETIIKINDEGLPVFQDDKNSERKYIYHEIENGILQYVEDFKSVYGECSHAIMDYPTWYTLANCYLTYGNFIDGSVLEELDFSTLPISEAK